MYIKSITGGENAKTFCIIVADEGTGGIEKFFISSLFWKKLSDEFTKDTPVDENGYDKLKTAAERSDAVKAASRLIGYGDRSRGEIVAKLKNRGISAESAEYAALLLEKNGYLNDSDTCLRIAESAVISKHYGRKRIYEYLITHRYDKESAINAVNSISPEQYRDAVIYNLEHKYKGFSDVSLDERRKITAGLLRLGFSISEINDAIRSLKK